MPWHKIVMNRDEAIRGKGSQLQREFEAIFFTFLGPEQLALFTLRDMLAEPRLYYVSLPEDMKPHPDLFLERYSATPCEKPKKSDVGLLVGDMAAWDMLE
jgi:hypothetical protein